MDFIEIQSKNNKKNFLQKIKKEKQQKLEEKHQNTCILKIQSFLKFKLIHQKQFAILKSDFEKKLIDINLVK